jgi:autotransporter-associated beta strand protein
VPPAILIALVFTVTNSVVNLSAGTLANGTLFSDTFACTDAGIILATLAGSASMTKSGSGTLALRGSHTFTGPLSITCGTVELQASPAAGSVVWLDATALTSIAKNADGTGGTPMAGEAIGRWTSLSGSNWVSTTATTVTYQTNVLNGLPVLRFGSSMTFNSNVVAQGSTAFIVYKQTGVLNNYQQPLDSTGQTPTSGWLHMIDNLNRRCFVKGGGGVNLTSTVPSTNWAVQAVQIQTNLYTLWVNEATYSSGDSTSTFTPFTKINVIGDIAEILIYTNLLNAADRMATLSYLEKKWLGISVVSAVTNTLSSTLAAEVKSGAVLDLCGGSQTVAGLSGSGRVTNGTLTVTGWLTPGDTSTVAGVLTVGENLTLASGVTHVFDYVQEGADAIHVTGALTVLGPNTVEVFLHGQRPPAEMTLFTFSTLEGEAMLSSWTVQGVGLEGYQTRIVRKDRNTIVLKMALMGSLIKLL